MKQLTLGILFLAFAFSGIKIYFSNRIFQLSHELGDLRKEEASLLVLRSHLLLSGKKSENTSTSHLE